MTFLLTIDPGLNTGIALGRYDATTPYTLLRRWQVHRGLEGFLDWLESGEAPEADEIVVEKFLSMRNEAAPDISGVPIEGAIALWARGFGAKVVWQNRMDKGALLGRYPQTARTKVQRQRVRFDFLESKGLFMAGTENDDSNDAITHALVYLKRQEHQPTLRWLFPPRSTTA